MSNEKKYQTYIYRHPITKEPFYVGKGSGLRAYQHMIESHNEDVNAYIRELRLQKLEPLVRFFEMKTEEEAYAFERFLIERYGRKDLGTGPLLNHSGGEKGTPKEVKQARSKIAKRKYLIRLFSDYYEYHDPNYPDGYRITKTDLENGYSYLLEPHPLNEDLRQAMLLARDVPKNGSQRHPLVSWMEKFKSLAGETV